MAKKLVHTIDRTVEMYMHAHTWLYMHDNMHFFGTQQLHLPDAPELAKHVAIAW